MPCDNPHVVEVEVEPHRWRETLAKFGPLDDMLGLPVILRPEGSDERFMRVLHSVRRCTCCPWCDRIVLLVEDAPRLEIKHED